MKRRFYVALLLLTFFPLIIGVLIYAFVPEFRFIRNHIPDTLWSFSLYSTLRILGAFNSNKKSVLTASLCTFFFYEIGQKLNWFSGTYDHYDIVSYLVGVLIAFIFVDRFYQRQY